MAQEVRLAMQVLGYVRVSTSEQADSGAGLEVQRQAIVAEVERRGWQLLEIVEDAGYSAKSLKRPGIQSALAAQGWRG
jgi:DNA invertase Pin-like site-specific DNA recombinase